MEWSNINRLLLVVITYSIALMGIGAVGVIWAFQALSTGAPDYSVDLGATVKGVPYLAFFILLVSAAVWCAGAARLVWDW